MDNGGDNGGTERAALYEDAMDADLPEHDAPDVTVVVPHYNDYARLDRCLTALAAQDFGGTREIIVADNDSPGGPARIAATVAGRARIVVATAKGAGPARNAGVAAARGRILAFTDADCLPEAGWLAAGIAALSAPDTVVGGCMTVLSGMPRSGAEAFETVFAFDNAAYVRAKGFTVTANLFVARGLFDRVGPFRTGLSEDVEWCWRARAAGARLVYAPGAVVGHPARRDWRELAAKWERLTHETYLLDRERGKSPGWVIARAWAMLLETPRALVRVLRSPVLAPGERRAAAAVLIRLRLFRFALGHRLALRGG